MPFKRALVVALCGLIGIVVALGYLARGNLASIGDPRPPPLAPKRPITSPSTTIGSSALGPFDIHDDDEVAEFLAMRQAQQTEAAEIIARHEQGELTDSELFSIAATAHFHRDRNPRIRWLVENIDNRYGPVPVTRISRLTGYINAESLAELGAPTAADAVLETLGKDLTNKRLAIRALVLRRVDSRAGLAERTRLARLARGGDQRFEEHLSRVWALMTEVALRDRRNWPSRMPADPGEVSQELPSNYARPPAALLAKDFDFKNPAHRSFLYELERSVQPAAASVLAQQARAKPPDEKLILRALTLAAAAPAKNEVEIYFEHFLVRDPSATEPAGPLDGYPAASALAAVGGWRERDRLLQPGLGLPDSLRRPLSESQQRQELLLRAWVLNAIDRPEIVRHLAHDRASAEIKSCFDAPGFFDDPANWPSRLPHD